MDLDEQTADDVTIVAIAGRLDTRTAEQFSVQMAGLMRSGQTRVLIEASQLHYISSAGFRALLVATKLAAELRARLAICSVTAPIMRMIQLGGFDGELNVYASRDEALAVLSAD